MMIHPGKTLVLRIRDQMPVDQLWRASFPSSRNDERCDGVQENGAAYSVHAEHCMCSFHFDQII